MIFSTGNNGNFVNKSKASDIVPSSKAFDDINNIFDKAVIDGNLPPDQMHKADNIHFQELNEKLDHSHHGSHQGPSRNTP